MTFQIRPYHLSDLPDLYRICLRTGASGADATDLYKDPDLLAHYYAGPYLLLDPDLCFVLTQDGTPCGYILGARDSAAFSASCERAWFPPLRQRYPVPAADDASPDAQIIRLIHAGYHPEARLSAYPAHLHIDLLPIAQGQGWGRRLMQTFLDHLRSLAVPGVHLGVGSSNVGAIQFYERVGFHRIFEGTGWIAFGQHLRSNEPQTN
ncbi:MAG: GNAT family N-acetyltransferase [Chloroflexi bacterium]|nr:GNAT family N-acetyltransferase [Chloroflexota bacterium]